VRQKIDELDESLHAGEEEERLCHSVLTFEHVTIGSPQSKITFENLEKQKISDVAFNRFRIRLADFFNDFLPSHGIPLPEGKRIKFSKEHTVSVHSTITVY
jgi:hypothetical protein